MIQIDLTEVREDTGAGGKMGTGVGRGDWGGGGVGGGGDCNNKRSYLGLQQEVLHCCATNYVHSNVVDM